MNYSTEKYIAETAKVKFSHLITTFARLAGKLFPAKSLIFAKAIQPDLTTKFIVSIAKTNSLLVAKGKLNPLCKTVPRNTNRFR